jgi:adenine deaminase
MKIRPYSLEEYQRLVHVSLGRTPASVCFLNARFLNVYTGQIDQGNIYLAGKRIAYVGNKQFPLAPETKVIEADEDTILVPGYIEPHTHPCQMYNPLTWGEALLKEGTVASMNDNLTLLMLLEQQALNFIEELDARGKHLWLWWCTFDAKKTAVARRPELLQTWMKHPLVIQGGEFTAWSTFLHDDPDLLNTMYALKTAFVKRVEGHLPGASAETLNALAAAGIGADHEALNGDDILKRLRLGLYATLRYSSIRPDLPAILGSIAFHPQLNLNRLMLTSDGPAPFFVEKSSCANMIKLVMQSGLPPVAAYRMATLNPATYYGIDEDLGGIAPGRLACFNILQLLDDPTPLYDLAPV